jgi:hypothetical protein
MALEKEQPLLLEVPETQPNFTIEFGRAIT